MRRQSVSRRSFLKAASVFAAGFSGGARSAPARKPNLLFLWTDEQRPDTMAAYGNPRIKTPNLNKLASESVVFRRAYDTQPVCTPARSSIMTGRWPHATGCVSNNIPLPDDARCFPEIMNDPDYRTGYFGKWHLGDEVFAQHGFEEWAAIEDGYSKYYRSDRDPNAKSAYWAFLNELGYKPDTENGNYSRGFASNLKIEHCKPSFLELKARDFLRRHKTEPFILHVNYLEPHMPFHGPLDDLHPLSEVTVPGNFEDLLEDNEPLRFRAMRDAFLANGFGKLPLKTEADWRRLIANYWGLVSQVDRSVGGILSTLEELGLSDNTIVVYTSDHGDMMGSHRLLTKTVSYEESVGIPLLLRIPARGRTQQVVEQPVSQIDLVPTLLELMGYPREESLPGQSLVSLMKGNPAQEDHVFIEWNRPRNTADFHVGADAAGDLKAAMESQSRTVISPDGWKLVLSRGDKSQLFNLTEDPGETTNLFDSRKHAEVISRLTARIRAWQAKVNDTLEV
ncbi:MAG: Multifunctional alkaline phosphatase superfamily protein PehA [bacterium]|nr:Multifunctional alkaline phosphatase superfamily protein PehA [bacterium]